MSNDFLPVHLIQTFVAFIESANITEAAERLGISQPAASVHLKKLEEMLPHPVFTMQGKRKVPNEYGKALYHTLSPALKNLNQQLRLVNAEFSDNARTFLVGYETADLVSAFNGNSPDKKFKFEQVSLLEGQKKIEDNEIDLYLSSKKINSAKTFNKRLEKKAWALCVHPKWTRQKKTMITEPWLLQTPMIMLASQSETQKKSFEKLFEHYCSGRKDHPNMIFVDNSLLQKEFVHQGLGYALLCLNPQNFTEQRLEELTIHWLPESLLPSENSYLVYRDRTSYETTVQSFSR